MDTVFWVILIVVAVGIVWWLLNRNSSGRPGGRSPGAGSRSADGAMSSGGAAASADAAATSGIPTAAGFGRPAEPVAPATAEEPIETSAQPDSEPAHRTGSGSSETTAASAPSRPDLAGGTVSAGTPATTGTPATATAATSGTGRDEVRSQDQAEWETQWSEAGGTASGHDLRDGRKVHGGHAPQEAEAAAAARPVHHPEYTDPHAPTLPGAESAAAEQVDDDGGRAAVPHSAAGAATVGDAGSGGAGSRAGAAAGAATSGDAAAGQGIPPEAAAAETLDRTQSSAVVENGADHSVPGGPDGATGSGPEGTGHLAADEPYGTGSAAAGADGSGPADYTVKGDAGAMVYYEEGHPDFDQTRADVWFESAAHAEAAGFRAPRRRRL